MEDFNTDDLDGRVSDYFSRQLEGQVGRSLAAFQNAAVPRPIADRPARQRRWLVAAYALAAAAALVAVVWGGRRTAVWPGPVVEPPLQVVHVPPGPADQEESPEPDKIHLEQVAVTARPQPRVLEQAVRYRTLDEGIVVIDGRRPVRKLRRQWLERIAWFDAASGARLERIVPREEIVYLEIPVN